MIKFSSVNPDKEYLDKSDKAPNIAVKTAMILERAQKRALMALLKLKAAAASITFMESPVRPL